ncbi:hypothetical protein [Polaromonas sp.]|jgi:hypothetical protein|uniref:hypothetical protein n=1 Tax=Polaromonas sp. TaxID=1869339 RepID=UPI0037C5888F
MVSTTPRDYPGDLRKPAKLAHEYLVMECGEFIARGQGKVMQANGVQQLVAS